MTDINTISSPTPATPPIVQYELCVVNGHSSYLLFVTHCTTELVTFSAIIIPTPINIVDEYQEEGNARVQYNPKTKTTTIGKGNEKDAKFKIND